MAAAGEKIRQGRGDAQQKQLLETIRAIEFEEFDQIAIDGDEPLRRVDDERKERDREGEDGDAGQTGADPDHANRREDGQGGQLHRHQVGRWRFCLGAAAL